MPVTVKSQEEIDAVLERCADSSNKPSRYPNMTYEQGIEDALEWVFGGITGCEENWPLEEGD